MSSFEETNPPLREKNEQINQENEVNNQELNKKEKEQEPEGFNTYVVNHPLKYYDKFDDEEIGIKDNILKGIYSYGFERPSPIQRIAIKPLIEGRDIVIQSHSGTGKTGTFSIGMLNRIDEELKSPQAIVICNTRELAD